MKEFVINEANEKQRLNKYLLRLMPNAGSSFIYKMLRKKNIVLNGKKADGSEVLKCNDTIKVFFSDETFEKMSASFEKKQEFPSLDPKIIVYEDDNILIMNKPAGMLSQKAEKNDVSACEYLIGYLIKYKGFSTDSFKEYKPSAINRLDRNTTGLLVCAKNLRAASVLSECFKKRTLKKEYLCIVKGKVENSQYLKGYLEKDEKTNKVTISQIKNSNFVETSYTPLAFCDKISGTVLLVDLITGKTHQIRAHLASNGMPLAGDLKYGNQKWNEELKCNFKIKHQMLHSYRISFPVFDGILKELSNKVITVDPPFKYLYED